MHAIHYVQYQDAPRSMYGPTVDLLCSWGQHEHLVGAIVDSLGKAFASSAVGETRSDGVIGASAGDGGDDGNGNVPDDDAGARSFHVMCAEKVACRDQPDLSRNPSHRAVQSSVKHKTLLCYSAGSFASREQPC